MEYIITFHTHFDALQYNRFLKKHGVRCKMQPVPRALSSSCGTCIKFSSAEEIDGKSIFAEHEFDKLFKCVGTKYEAVIESE